MEALAIGSAILQVGSGIFGAVSQGDAADEARAIAEMNARAIEAETQREKELARDELKRNLAESRARAGASGLLLGTGEEDEISSHMLYIQEQKRVGEEAIDWIGQSGESRAAIARAEGEYAASVGEARGITSLFTGIGEGASTLSWYYS